MLCRVEGLINLPILFIHSAASSLFGDRFSFYNHKSCLQSTKASKLLNHRLNTHHWNIFIFFCDFNILLLLTLTYTAEKSSEKNIVITFPALQLWELYSIIEMKEFSVFLVQKQCLNSFTMVCSKLCLLNSEIFKVFMAKARITLFLKLILQLIIMPFLYMHLIKWIRFSKPLFLLPSSLVPFMAFLVHFIFKIYTLFIITIHIYYIFDGLGWILWAGVQAMLEIAYYLGTIGCILIFYLTGNQYALYMLCIVCTYVIYRRY